LSFDKNIADYIVGLGYDFTPDFTHPKKKWVSVTDDKLKGAWIYDTHLLKDGAEVVVFTVYDYRKQTSFTEHFSGRALSAGEQKNVAKKIEEQKELADIERRAKWKECQTYCFGEWERATPLCELEGGTGHPYATKKLGTEVGSLCNSELRFVPNNNLPGITTLRVRKNLLNELDLLIPMCDIDGGFWGYQIIHQDGTKQFDIGQRTDEVFYTAPVVPNPDFSRMYLCEGVATALSIALAINFKHPVIATFSAGNLKKVSYVFRKKYERASLVICADNDKWKPDIGNTGVKIGTDVCRELDGCALAIPDFSNLNETSLPTDFNDLHHLAGIEAVTRQLAGVTLIRPHILYPLGHNEGLYYFTSSEDPQIQRVREFSQTEFIGLRPLKFWELNYANEKGIVDWAHAKDDLIRDCKKRGIFDPGKVRGRGVFKEKDDIVIHLGNRLYYPNGEEKDLSDVESDNIYDPKVKALTPPKVSGSPELLVRAESIVNKFAWESPFEPKLFIGWIMVSPLAGILDWRPHVALTAQAGSGKTTLITHIVEPSLRHFQPTKLEGVSEASIRQVNKTDSVPLILDELDTNNLDEKGFSRVLTLLRAASSEGVIVRGTPSGKAMKFTAKFCTLLAGVNMPNFVEADKSRIAEIELVKGKQQKSWNEFQLEIKSVFNESWACFLFWDIYKKAEMILESSRILREFVGGVSDARTGQQYGTLLAGYWHFHNEKTIDNANAQKLALEFIAWQKHKSGTEDAAETDSENSRDHLMDLVIMTTQDRVQITLNALLSGTETLESKNALLAAFGMKLVPEHGLFISSANPLLRKHFSGTPWLKWTTALKRTQGHFTQVRFGTKRPRGLMIPMEIKKDEF
jgi:hypothetical protein